MDPVCKRFILQYVEACEGEEGLAAGFARLPRPLQSIIEAMAGTPLIDRRRPLCPAGEPQESRKRWYPNVRYGTRVTRDEICSMLGDTPPDEVIELAGAHAKPALTKDNIRRLNALHHELIRGAWWGSRELPRDDYVLIATRCALRVTWGGIGRVACGGKWASRSRKWRRGLRRGDEKECRASRGTNAFEKADAAELRANDRSDGVDPWAMSPELRAAM